MARTQVTATPLVPNSHLTDPAGTTIDQANGMFIAKARPELMVFRVKNTAGSAANAIVRAGTYPPALASGQGDFTQSVAAGATEFLGPFESGRFLQNDGSLNLDFGSGFTGTVTVFQIPRNT